MSENIGSYFNMSQGTAILHQEEMLCTGILITNIWPSTYCRIMFAGDVCSYIRRTPQFPSCQGWLFSSFLIYLKNMFYVHLLLIYVCHAANEYLFVNIVNARLHSNVMIM